MISIAPLLFVLVAEDGYVWPLDLPRVVTSSFGEHRSGRFHMGLDLRTVDIGRPVRVAADGYVRRVQCSPWGYGKVVYVQLEDGNVAVYGHLDAFAAPLAEYVRRVQHEGKSYSVDLYPETGAFPVKRGEVIAFSGQTGIGPAHLHFELRDAGNRALNPRLLGITWPDATRPRIANVLIVPGGPDSSVNGDLLPLTVTPRRIRNGEYACDPVRVTGRLGFGVHVVDPANDGANRLGVYGLSAFAGDEELFRVRHDRLDYETLHHGAVAWSTFLHTATPFLLLWRQPGNAIESYQQAASDGWLLMADEPVIVRIEAVDFLGNVAHVTLPLVPDAVPAPQAPQGPGAGQGSVSIECLGDWLVITTLFAHPEPAAPQLTVEGLPTAEGGAFRRISPTTFRAGYRPIPAAGEVTLSVVHDRVRPNQQTFHVFVRGGGALSASWGDAVVLVRPNSPFGTTFISVESLDLSAVPASPIPMLGKAYHLQPEETPVDEPVELSLPIPEGVRQLDRVHIYHKTGSRWTRENTIRADNRLIVKTRRFGTFVAMEDDIPPLISAIHVSFLKEQSPRRPMIRADVTDLGSGIAEVSATCGGRWLLMEYDPESHRVTWARDEDLPTGAHEVVLTATDVAGNKTTASRPVAIDKQQK